MLLNELPRFNGLALQMIWSMLGTFSCLHRDLASDMEQLFQSFAQQVTRRVSSNKLKFYTWLLFRFCVLQSTSPYFLLFCVSALLQLPHSPLDRTAFWRWAESAVLEGARRLETLCRSVEDTLNAPAVQVGTNRAEMLEGLLCVRFLSVCRCTYLNLRSLSMRLIKSPFDQRILLNETHRID